MKKARECDGYLGGDCLSCGNKKKTVCLVITYIVFSMTNIIDTMDIMDIMEEEPCSVKVDMTLLKNPRICVNLKILDVDVVTLLHLTTDAF